MKRKDFLKSLGIGIVLLSAIGCKPKKIEKPEDFKLSNKDIKKIIDNRSSEGFPKEFFISKVYNLIEIKKMVPKNGHMNYYNNGKGLKIINIADYKYDVLCVFKKIGIGEWIAIYYNQNNKYKKC
jgi:hypothetical protein